MVIVVLPTTVLLHGILCHSHSDINRCLIALSELWKLICFLSINDLNTGVVFCYFHLPIIDTTLVINKLRHLSYYLHECNYYVFQSLFHIWLVGHIGVCPTKLSQNLLPYIFYCMFILFLFYVCFIMLVLYVFVLWLSPVQYNVHQNCKALRAFLG